MAQSSREVDLDELIDRQPLSRFSGVLLGLSVLVTFLDGYDLMVLSFVGNDVSRELGLGRSMLGNVFSVGLLGTMIGAVLSGWAGDRFGRRPALIVSTLAFGITTLIVGMAQGYVSLLAARFIQGVMLGGALPLLWALNVDYAPLRRRATVTTVVTLGFALGAALAGPIALVVAGWASWRGVFVVGGVFSIIVAVLLMMWLPESLRHLQRRGAAPATLLRAVRRFAPREPLPDDCRFRLSSSGAETRSSAKFRDLFSGHLVVVTPLIWLAYLLSSIAAYLFTTWGPILLEELGFARNTAAWLASLNGFAGIIGGLAVMRFTDRHGARAVAALPLSAMLLMLVLGLVALAPAAFGTLYVLLGALITGGHAGVMSLIGPAFPSALRATGSGWTSAVGKIGSILGPQFGGFLLASALPVTSAFAITSVIPLLVGVTLLALAACSKRSDRRDNL